MFAIDPFSSLTFSTSIEIKDSASDGYVGIIFSYQVGRKKWSVQSDKEVLQLKYT